MTEVTRCDDLSPKQYRALCLFAAGWEKERVCTFLNIHPRTVERWQSLPEFRKLLKQATFKCFEEALAEMTAGATRASRHLLDIIDNSDNERNKLKAIEILFRVLNGGDVGGWSQQTAEYQEERERRQRLQSSLFN